MFLRYLSAVALAATLSATETQAATVITFDDLPARTIVSNQFSGVTFSTSTGFGPTVQFGGFLASSSDNVLVNADANFQNIGDLIMTFDAPASGVSFVVSAEDADFTVVTEHGGATNRQLFPFDGSSLELQLVDLSQFDAVTRVTVEIGTFPQILSGGIPTGRILLDAIAIDDLAFTPAVVPLPAGGLLMLTALGSIALLRRRRGASDFR